MSGYCIYCEEHVKTANELQDRLSEVEAERDGYIALLRRIHEYGVDFTRIGMMIMIESALAKYTLPEMNDTQA